MLPLRFVGRWRVAGAMMLLLVLVSTLMPALVLVPNVGLRAVLQFDKWVHGIVFLLLALWFTGQYARRSYWRVASGLVAFGAFIEICQYFTVYRTAEWQDLYADIAGIAAGLLGGWLWTGGWSLRMEHWWLARRQADN